MLRFVLRLTLATGLGLAGWLVYYGMSPVPAMPETGFVIESGETLSGVARKLAGDRVIEYAWGFTTLGRVFGMAGRIKAGSYQVGDAKTHYGLLRRITQGVVTLDKITIVEGWTFAEMRAAIDSHVSLRHTTRTLTERELMTSMGAETVPAEGRFYPDTYYFDRGSNDLDLYRRAYFLMQSKLDQAWAGRAGDLPYTNPGQALTMASIIEKETGAPDERPLIAAVFVNRLRLGMRLQTDPTVIYGLGDRYDGNLRRDDLLQDTPYNTYTRAGLPPGPIALPGEAALVAALHPENSRMLYFVAKGGGRHQFSGNLEDHNRAVNRYQRGR
jgi:UPF0755 protein